MPNTQELLARFHHALVVEIRKSRPDYLHAPFTVAEIYQNLVPYRSHRDVIGVEMNGDYEDALLRLLAGEGDFLVLESEVARREIRDELQTGNPNTGLFRDFAAADVKLNPEKLDDEGVTSFVGDGDESVEYATSPDVDAVEESPHEDDFESALAHPEDVATLEMAVVEPIEPESEPLDQDELFDRDETLDREEAALDQEDASAEGMAAPAVEAPSAAQACRWCRAELPEREGMQFCPFCGSDLERAPCAECGEEIAADWRYCIKCGTEVRS